MNLHEYQAKRILKKYDIPIPEFAVVETLDDVRKIVGEMDLDQAVLKIQVHAGGRGKAGGVKFAKSKSDIEKIAASLLGMCMVNLQTGPEGVIANTVLIAKPVDIAKEYYLGAVIDRELGKPILIASPEGGMEIEESQNVIKMPFSIEGKLRAFQILRLCKFMGWTGETAKQGAHIAKMLAKCFIDTDASLLEINPLVLTPQQQLYAIDAKLSIDDNALFRQKEIAAMYDTSQVSEQESLAKNADLAYIAMQGDIGCMVNGAGLAMATMDMIQLYGGAPANFLDVGGSATKEKVADGFRIILSDPKVKAILVNIFGGIMNCATLAEGLVHAAKEQNIKVPIVVRLEGTNVVEGKQILRASGLKIATAEDFQKGAELVVAFAKGKKNGHSH